MIRAVRCSSMLADNMKISQNFFIMFEEPYNKQLSTVWTVCISKGMSDSDYRSVVSSGLIIVESCFSHATKARKLPGSCRNPNGEDTRSKRLGMSNLRHHKIYKVRRNKLSFSRK